MVFFQPFASMMRIETVVVFRVVYWWSAFSHSPVWWGLKPRPLLLWLRQHRQLSAIRQYDEDWNCCLITAIAYCLSFSHSPVWWGLKLFKTNWQWRIGHTFSHSPVWWGLKRRSKLQLLRWLSLSAIRQYDEDWNDTETTWVDDIMPFSHSPVWWGLKRLTICYKVGIPLLSAIRQYDEDWNFLDLIRLLLLYLFQPFASMMRIETLCY